ncbi:hypothetical protein ACS0TY_010026 [Phlomoides rotata]
MQIVVSHIFWEGNASADRLSRESVDSFEWWSTIPDFLTPFLNRDRFRPPWNEILHPSLTVFDVEFNEDNGVMSMPALYVDIFNRINTYQKNRWNRAMAVYH